MTASPLYLMIRAARAELAAESPVALHTHHAPKLLDADGTTSHYPDEGGIGLPFTAQFHRLLADAPEFVMRASLRHIADWCSQRHVTHTREHGAPLCAEMADLAVRSWFEPDAIAALFGVRPPLVRDILSGALSEAAAWRDNERKRINAVEVNEQERVRARHSETIEDRLSAEHDLAHQERAWLAYRRKYDRIPPWDEELARRREKHKILKCPGCPLLAEAA
jgi:hypothetical protein